jgi:hypothetical protein
LNPHGAKHHEILSLARLPVPPLQRCVAQRFYMTPRLSSAVIANALCCCMHPDWTQACSYQEPKEATRCTVTRLPSSRSSSWQPSFWHKRKNNRPIARPFPFFPRLFTLLFLTNPRHRRNSKNRTGRSLGTGTARNASLPAEALSHSTLCHRPPSGAGLWFPLMALLALRAILSVRAMRGQARGLPRSNRIEKGW